MKFRHDINALRALAVFVVILFHLDFKFLSGGYIGVDIFFVISGYLISKSILYKIDKHKFDLIDFYTKRVKRLFPALVFVSLITMFSGFFILTPIDYKNLGESSLASVFFMNNIFFWLESGYFDALKSSKPLLHYWSLAVEFQFYLFYPILILFIKNKKLPFKLSILFVCLTSFILAILGNHYFPSASFYLLPYRIFEFALGTFAVILQLKLQNNIKKLITILSYIVIIICCFTYKSPTFFSYYNLYPCIAVFFIINLKSTGKLLTFLYENKIVQLIGKTSYSAYLIHWPIIVYYKYIVHNNLTTLSKLSLLAFSFFLGFWIWKYVENTLRKPTNNLKSIGSTVLIVSFLSVIIITTDGFAYRYPLLKDLITSKELKGEKQRYWKELYQKLNELKQHSKEVIVMGNSHAIDLSYAFIENDIKAKISFLKTDHRCYNCNMPLEDQYKNLCEKINQKNLNHSSWKTASAIYIHDNWPVSDTLNLRYFLSKIRQKTTVPIYVFGPKLTFPKPALNIICASQSTNTSEINSFAIQHSEISKRRKINNDLIHFFNNYHSNNNINYIDILKLQCGTNYNSGEIISNTTSKLLYFDRDHFTREGSIELGKKLKEVHPNLFF